MTDWSFLTTHARVLLCIAHDPGVRLRDIAARTGVTERTAYGIVTDSPRPGTSSSTRTAAATATRSRPTCHSGPTGRERTIGEILALLASDGATGLSTREEGLAVTPADGGQTGISHG